MDEVTTLVGSGVAFGASGRRICKGARQGPECQGTA
jgi:hypothetical protein